MVLEKKALEKLEKLLEMSKENFVEMLERWQDTEKNSLYVLRNMEQFKIGYVVGKIEHKFISWFYSEFGRSQTDEEYNEFLRIVKKRIP
jgi:phosphatidate phosphatase PAH1